MKYSLFDLIRAWLKTEFKFSDEELTSSGWWTTARRNGNETIETSGTCINYYLRLGPYESSESEILSITSNDEITVPGEYAGPSNPSVFKIYNSESFGKLHECVAARIKILRHE